jgi:acetoin utilization protein AcuB
LEQPSNLAHRSVGADSEELAIHDFIDGPGHDAFAVASGAPERDGVHLVERSRRRTELTPFRARAIRRVAGRRLIVPSVDAPRAEIAPMRRPRASRHASSKFATLDRRSIAMITDWASAFRLLATAARLAASLLTVDSMKRDNLRHPIIQFMTRSPHSVGRDQTLSTAVTIMHRHGVRHLPVLEGGLIVGLLSQRDILFVETLRDVDPSTLLVEEAMSSDVYAVSPEAPLAEVVADMAEHKYGCVVVVEHKHVAGIFTTVDALRVLVSLLREDHDQPPTAHVP